MYWFSIRAQRDPYLDRYWEDRFFDLRNPAHGLFHMAWLTAEIFRFILPPWGIVLTPIAIVGAISWWRQKRFAAIRALIAPILLVAAAGIVHLYPYGGTRVTLFWSANIAILSAAGIQAIAAEFRNKALKCATWGIGIATLVAAAVIAAPCLVHPRSYGDM